MSENGLNFFSTWLTVCVCVCSVAQSCPVLWLALIHNLNFLKVKFILNYMQLRRRKWHPTAVLLPGKSHGWRRVVGYSPWGCKESDATERLHFTSLLCLRRKKAEHFHFGFWEIRLFFPPVYQQGE